MASVQWAGRGMDTAKAFGKVGPLWLGAAVNMRVNVARCIEMKSAFEACFSSLPSLNAREN
jgi:hypothetical protein